MAASEITVPFYVKKYFRIKQKRRQKLITLLINQVLFSFKTKKDASFAEMNMILITIPSYQSTLFSPYKQILPDMCFFL